LPLLEKSTRNGNAGRPILGHKTLKGMETGRYTCVFHDTWSDVCDMATDV